MIIEGKLSGHENTEKIDRFKYLANLTDDMDNRGQVNQDNRITRTRSIKKKQKKQGFL